MSDEYDDDDLVSEADEEPEESELRDEIRDVNIEAIVQKLMFNRTRAIVQAAQNLAFSDETRMPHMDSIKSLLPTPTTTFEPPKYQVDETNILLIFQPSGKNALFLELWHYLLPHDWSRKGDLLVAILTGRDTESGVRRRQEELERGISLLERSVKKAQSVLLEKAKKAWSERVKLFQELRSQGVERSTQK